MSNITTIAMLNINFLLLNIFFHLWLLLCSYLFNYRFIPITHKNLVFCFIMKNIVSVLPCWGIKIHTLFNYYLIYLFHTFVWYSCIFNRFFITYPRNICLYPTNPCVVSHSLVSSLFRYLLKSTSMQLVSKSLLLNVENFFILVTKSFM